MITSMLVENEQTINMYQRLQIGDNTKLVLVIIWEVTLPSQTE